MRYGILNPRARTLTYHDANDPRTVYRQAGLRDLETDHGVLAPLPHRGGIGYVVYQYGFYVPPAQQFYCSITGTNALIAGPAVLYEFAEGGATIDLDDWKLEPIWFSGPEAVEEAIEAGSVSRPVIAINGEIVWAWPQPAPSDIAAQVRA